ncbi:MAG: tetratricopeptide repeat protein [Alphaproteobacteria bacterium]
MITIRRLALVLVLALLAGSLVGASVPDQAAQAQSGQAVPAPGARSPLSPPETDKEQAAAFKRGYEAYYRGEYEQAAAIWARLADQGHVKSMNNIGTMYAQGKGVSRNYSLAAFYYRRAAALNDARAAYNLAIAYERGRGVVQDDAEAVAWYRKAADRGLVEAMNAMAWIYATSPDLKVRDGAEAVRWAQRALQRKTSSKSLATLAAAQAELGEYRRAVATIDQAIAYMRREESRAGLLGASEYEFIGLLRQVGRTDDLFDLLERREFYANGQATRD